MHSTIISVTESYYITKKKLKTKNFEKKNNSAMKKN